MISSLIRGRKEQKTNSDSQILTTSAQGSKNKTSGIGSLYREPVHIREKGDREPQDGLYERGET